MKKFRMLAALCAALVISLSVTTVAYAGGGDEVTEETTETAVTEAASLTPEGNLTLVDDLSGEQSEDKQFITVITKNGNYFYIIIDRADEEENVYFLNMVDEADLLALMEDADGTGLSESTSAISDTDNTAAVTTPEPEAESEADTDMEAEAETNSGGGSSIVIIVLIVLAAGGAGYYFKIYRPKQLANTGDEYEAGDEYDEYEVDGQDTYGDNTEPEDDGPPWYEDEEEYAGDDGDGEA